MKIGITCYPSLGGSGVVATELGKLLAERGHQVHFITGGMPFRLGAFHPNIFYHEVEVNNYDVFKYPPYDLTLASRMAQVAKNENLDLLHVHYAVPHALCAFLAKQMVGDHLKIVTTLHGTDITVLGYDSNLSDMIRFGIERSDLVTAVSNDLIRQTKELLHTDKEIVPVYNFVDKRRYYPKEVAKLKKVFAPNGEKILMHISNFRPVKRVPDVIEIFSRVREEVPSRLILIGEGPEMGLVRKMIADLGLNDDVCFLGKQEDVAEVLSMADIMLLPSEKESFGLVALEAMACGVPVVATVAGGLPEVVLDGVNGFLRPIGDVEGMAKETIRLLQDEELYREFSANSIERSCKTFCHETIASQYEALYANLLASKSEEKLSF
ncbi:MULTISPECIES: N-acetyl-alpha-D-glucosaminyl L-malate synthase BshA [Brevibacillus]|uniref:N-acetyl-alpha-D-glucosaminyl L-malate synthase BshA n=1 Tax=Brevibacillus TaxID=55080 RepID=UPI000D0F7760|nr:MULTISPECIES: N-acetyl-alpha-D-glucosaminyl L-malate synthase BshA [Brevibacillus]MED1944334.1 N-acetyl-alpha-D-glucosaminyl L-malate synthase BshA [Brevibacillus formosus]MED1999294.1 N-acetyl-alpha-D-glucosaminyl L-malate synthase BshA [Brevibacillus formosus]MED2082569.1 N-acetyl-alpha-D-glucosaminyl L-malate synthase BshA [Brevibacillus formosus]PSK07341.1 N-acetyl-alpha-D-glucosaminyl L-malate synthase BshA [Brevibacillus sp. NRRL NRS-603]